MITIQFDVFNLSFIFFILMFQTISTINRGRWCMLFFTCINLVANVLVCTIVIACIKWKRLNKQLKSTHFESFQLFPSFLFIQCQFLLFHRSSCFLCHGPIQIFWKQELTIEIIMPSTIMITKLLQNSVGDDVTLRFDHIKISLGCKTSKTTNAW